MDFMIRGHRMKVSIIILTYDRAYILSDTVNSILKQSHHGNPPQKTSDVKSRIFS